jgi:CubicO group peptidase (beta-lactamase class C family)
LKRQALRLYLAIALCLAAPPCLSVASAQVANADSSVFERVNQIFASYKRAQGPGYAVGIIQNGRLVYARGFGLADVDQRVAITSSTVFNVASLSKQFTAASIGLLITRGKLTLEDEVKRHIPEFPDYAGPVRIKHLVYMTSGLPEYYTLQRPGGRTWDTDYFTVDDAIATVLAQSQLQFAPGTKWAYSNINYMLLADIVRRVSSKSFADFAAQEIFDPLQMNSTHVNDDVTKVIPNRAIGYNHATDGGFRQEIRRSPHYGGSGVFSSIEDLAKWDRSFETHTLGGPQLTNLLLSTMKFEHEKTNDAFGLVWGTHRGLRTIWYEGGDAGFSGYMVRFPDQRFTVIVLSNLGTGRAAEHARRVIDVFLTSDAPRHLPNDYAR